MATCSVPACRVRTGWWEGIVSVLRLGMGQGLSDRRKQPVPRGGCRKPAVRVSFPGGLGGRAQEEMVHTAAHVPGRTPSLSLGFRCRSRSRSQMKP